MARAGAAQDRVERSGSPYSSMSRRSSILLHPLLVLFADGVKILGGEGGGGVGVGGDAYLPAKAATTREFDCAKTPPTAVAIQPSL